MPLNQRERTQITQDIIHEVLGLGPLEPLLADERERYSCERPQAGLCRTIRTDSS